MSWSPDGTRLAFIADESLWVVDRDGKGRRHVTPASWLVWAVAWSPDGRRLAIGECRDSALSCGVSVSDGRGTRWNRIAKRPTRAMIHDELDVIWRVTWAPDGGQIAFVRGLRGDFVDIVVASVAGTGEQVLAPGDDVIWAPDGRRLAYRHGDGLFVIGNDGLGKRRVTTVGLGDQALAWSRDGRSLLLASPAGRLAIASVRGGAPRPLTRAVPLSRAGRDQAWAPDGSSRAVDRARRIEIVRPGGTRTPLLRPIHDASPSWSTDGTKIGFTRVDGKDVSVQIMASDGTGLRRLARGGAPKWAPNGDTIAFMSSGGTIRAVDSVTGVETLVAQGHEFTWSPDGIRIAFLRGEDSLYAVAATGGEPLLLARLKINDTRCREAGIFDPSWSPDGRWIALLLREAVQDCETAAVVLVPAAGGPPKVLQRFCCVSAIHYGPVWSSDSSTVLYDDGGDIRSVRPSGAALPRPRVFGQAVTASPDGSTLALVREAPFGHQSSIWVTSADGSRTRRLTFGGVDEEPRWERKPQR